MNSVKLDDLNGEDIFANVNDLSVNNGNANSPHKNRFSSFSQSIASAASNFSSPINGLQQKWNNLSSTVSGARLYMSSTARQTTDSFNNRMSTFSNNYNDLKGKSAEKWEATKTKFHEFDNSLATGYSKAAEKANEGFHIATLLGKHTAKFLSTPSNLLFVAVTCLNASYAPEIFCASVVAGVAGRLAWDHQCKTFMKENFKEENNTYITNPYYGPNSYLSAFEHSAAFSALSYHLFFRPTPHPCLQAGIAGNSVLFPALAGIAVGSAIAKMGLDIARGIEDKFQ